MNKWIMLLLLTAACGAQDKPKPKKVPLYKTVMVCPKGQKLYIQQPSGFKSIRLQGGALTNVAQMLYEWRTWDGRMYLLQSELDTARCFKNPPQKEAPSE
jgi:hypothetical protein